MNQAYGAETNIILNIFNIVMISRIYYGVFMEHSDHHWLVGLGDGEEGGVGADGGEDQLVGEVCG